MTDQKISLNDIKAQDVSDLQPLFDELFRAKYSPLGELSFFEVCKKIVNAIHTKEQNENERRLLVSVGIALEKSFMQAAKKQGFVWHEGELLPLCNKCQFFSPSKPQ